MLLEWWAEGSREMRPLLASSLLLLATVGAACERGEHADGVAPITAQSEIEGGDADADETGRTVQRGVLAFDAPKTDAIDRAFERHAYLVEVEGEAVITVQAEATSGDLGPALTIHAPLLAGFNPEALAIAEAGDAGGSAVIDEIVLPEAGVYLVVVGSDDGQGRGEYQVEARCDAGACAVAPALLDCLPPVADRIFACADQVMDAVDTNPEDGVITPVDALHSCTRPDELASVHAELCDGSATPACDLPFDVFAEAQGIACFQALQKDFEAPLDLTEISMPDALAAALAQAVEQRCPEASCTVELQAWAYGDQYPSLKEATLVTAALANPEAAGSYAHSSAWALEERLVDLEIGHVVEGLRGSLDLETPPVVGRLFGATPVDEHIDRLVETHVALFRPERVIMTLEVSQPAS